MAFRTPPSPKQASPKSHTANPRTDCPELEPTSLPFVSYPGPIYAMQGAAVERRVLLCHDGARKGTWCRWRWVKGRKTSR